MILLSLGIRTPVSEAEQLGDIVLYAQHEIFVHRGSTNQSTIKSPYVPWDGGGGGG
jgi:hypothetical protein